VRMRSPSVARYRDAGDPSVFETRSDRCTLGTGEDAVRCSGVLSKPIVLPVELRLMGAARLARRCCRDDGRLLSRTGGEWLAAAVSNATPTAADNSFAGDVSDGKAALWGDCSAELEWE